MKMFIVVNENSSDEFVKRFEETYEDVYKEYLKHPELSILQGGDFDSYLNRELLVATNDQLEILIKLKVCYRAAFPSASKEDKNIYGIVIHWKDNNHIPEMLTQLKPWKPNGS